MLYSMASLSKMRLLRGYFNDFLGIQIASLLQLPSVPNGRLYETVVVELSFIAWYFPGRYYECNFDRIYLLVSWLIENRY